MLGNRQTDRPVRLIDNNIYDVQRVQMATSQCLYNNNARTPEAQALSLLSKTTSFGITHNVTFCGWVPPQILQLD